jgi:hypothetical protein
LHGDKRFVFAHVFFTGGNRGNRATLPGLRLGLRCIRIWPGAGSRTALLRLSSTPNPLSAPCFNTGTL